MKKLFTSLLMSIFLLLPLTLNAFTLDSDEGDIAIWELPLQSPGSQFYENQEALAVCRYELTGIHAYVPYYAVDLNSWDGRTYPLGYTAYCYHIEVLPANYVVPNDTINNHYRLVLLKPTANVPWPVNSLRAHVNYIEQVSSGYYVANEELDDYFYGRITKAEFTPMKAPSQSFWNYVTLRENNNNFWSRYCNCSASVAWGIWSTFYEAMNSTDQALMLNYMAGHDGYTAQDMVISHDAMSPGALADWLVTYGYYYVYQIYSF